MKTTKRPWPGLGLISTMAGLAMWPWLVLALGPRWWFAAWGPSDLADGSAAPLGPAWLRLGACALASCLGLLYPCLRVLARLERLEREKAALKENLAQCSNLAALGQLAASVAHEINNPLAIIAEQAGWIKDLLSDGQTLASPDMREILDSTQRIEHQLARIKGITQRSLGLARANTPTPVDVPNLIKQTLKFLESPIQSKNLLVNLDLAQNPPLVETDPALLEQILVNLVTNALDAMDNNGQLTIAARLGADPGELALSVADNGCGIPEACQAKVFDPFYTTKKPGQGTGLGLAITAGLVAKLGGRIGVKSQSGQGCTFTVTLPLKAKKSAAFP